MRQVMTTKDDADEMRRLGLAIDGKKNNDGSLSV